MSNTINTTKLTTINNLCTNSNRKMVNMQIDIDYIKSQVDNIKGDTENVKSDTENLKIKLEQISADNRIYELENKINGIEHLLTILVDEVRNINKKIKEEDEIKREIKGEIIENIDYIKNKLEKIDNTTIDIDQNINFIKSDFTIIESTLSTVEKSTQNINEHVDFVESVYDAVKSPFKYILKLYYNNMIYKNEDEYNKIEQIIDRKRIKET